MICLPDLTHQNLTSMYNVYTCTSHVYLNFISSSRQRPIDLAESQDMRFILNPTNISLSKLSFQLFIQEYPDAHVFIYVTAYI